MQKKNFNIISAKAWLPLSKRKQLENKFVQWAKDEVQHYHFWLYVLQNHRDLNLDNFQLNKLVYECYKRLCLYPSPVVYDAFAAAGIDVSKLTAFVSFDEVWGRLKQIEERIYPINFWLFTAIRNHLEIQVAQDMMRLHGMQIVYDGKLTTKLYKDLRNVTRKLNEPRRHRPMSVYETLLMNQANAISKLEQLEQENAQKVLLNLADGRSREIYFPIILQSFFGLDINKTEMGEAIYPIVSLLKPDIDMIPQHQLHTIEDGIKYDGDIKKYVITKLDTLAGGSWQPLVFSSELTSC
jgi:hypothetical protein